MIENMLRDSGSASQALAEHLHTGVTTVAHVWIIRRKDGVVLGFTDHDRDIEILGISCRATAGLTGLAFSQSTGMAVDHGEAIGAISDSSISQEDIIAGRFDNAEVEQYLVNWANPKDFTIRFRGAIGEITREGIAFRAELRGLSEHLNRPIGRVFTKSCSAVLGDRNCTIDLNVPGYRKKTSIYKISDSQDLIFGDELSDFIPGWFSRGTLAVLSGSAKGISRVIKYDRQRDSERLIGLWEPVDAQLLPGDLIELTAGCDKQPSTCRKKFNNMLNYRGFPDVPGEDWIATAPSRAEKRDGGSRR